MPETSIFIEGSGGRENAFGQALGQSVGKVYMAPGNGGNYLIPNAVTIDESVDPVEAAFEIQPDLVIIGPEAPLVAGQANRYREKGLMVLGPDQEAARLEASKLFAREFKDNYGIPHPKTKSTRSPENEIFLRANPNSIVLKVNGLAGGKGVLLPGSRQEMKRWLHEVMVEKKFGSSGNRVLIQERLHGPEVSMFVLSDGEKWLNLGFAQDHKKLFAGDKGPNTGGMGAFTPLPETILNQSQIGKLELIADKTVYGMKQEGRPFIGFLYIGAMLAEERGGDPVVIEYNVRMGDPEGQVIVRPDMLDVFISAAEGNLDTSWTPEASALGQAAITITLATEGYAEQPQPRTGDEIHGLDKDYESVTIHHGATDYDPENNLFRTAGGRALNVTAHGSDINQAFANARRAIGKENDGIWFDGMQFREDIAYQARSM